MPIKKRLTKDKPKVSEKDIPIGDWIDACNKFSKLTDEELQQRIDNVLKWAKDTEYGIKNNECRTSKRKTSVKR